MSKIILENDTLVSGVNSVLEIAENYVECFANCKNLVTEANEGGTMLKSMSMLCEDFGKIEKASNVSVEQIEYAVDKLKETIELNEDLSNAKGASYADLREGVVNVKRGAARTL